MKRKITKTVVDKAEAGIIWDTEIKGFGLRTSPEGKKVFFVVGRVRGKPGQVKFSIGAYGVYTPDEARKRAQKLLQDMREGVDPRDVVRQDAATRVTLSEVMESYLARPGKLKARSAAEIRRHVERIFSAWAAKPIASITEADVKKRYAEMCAKGLNGKRGSPGQANLSAVTLRALFNYAAREFKKSDGSPLIQHNPVSALRDHFVTLKPRTRDIPSTKIGAVWNMLQERRATTEQETAGWDLVQFLLLTGARLMEGASLQWENVNLSEGWWHLPAPKNNEPIWFPLSTQAQAILEQRKSSSPFVFASSRSKAGHIVDARAPFEEMSSICGHTISAHDLRRTFCSVGVASCQIDLFKIELLSGHKPQSVTLRHYLQTNRLQYLAPEVQAIGNWFETQAAIAAGRNVIPLRSKY